MGERPATSRLQAEDVAIPEPTGVQSTRARVFATFVVLAATLLAVPASVTPAAAQVCPSGTTLGNATWGTAGTMVWQNSAANQTSGASQTYNDIAGAIDLTVSYTDPDNVNEDLDNPYRNYVTGDSWDGPVYTRTNGTYGSAYFTIVMNSLRSDQIVDWNFSFNKPVFVPDFSVSDIDWAGYGYNSSGIGMPHESFQDEVVLAGQRGGNTIAFTAMGGSGIIDLGIIDLGGGQLVGGQPPASHSPHTAPAATTPSTPTSTAPPVRSPFPSLLGRPSPMSTPASCWSTRIWRS